MRQTKEILEEILRRRGIVLPEEVAEFLSDRPQKTYDPFLLFNMEAGVDLLLSEIERGTKICIYGDYDADGVTSVCILSHVFSMLTDRFTYYIPSRFEEGYGLNREAIQRLKEQQVGLIVTVDCGSVSYDEVEFAKELGMKVIVTDHHSIDDIKADCILINPKQQACTYPFKELAGCGVAFKLAQAIRIRTGLPRNAVNDVLDLAAVGTIGDIVSLTDENRTIVKYGLNKINGGSRRALRKLAEALALPEVTAENISYGIAPHINAAGRMASADEAVELFLTKDDAVIEEKVEKLVTLNAERKKKQEDAYHRCTENLTGKEGFILLNVPGLHEGIAGIVAGKIKENFNRPVIILTPSGENFLKGTGRSIPGIDIHRLLKKHNHLFERFGGHKSACGLLMRMENLPVLRKALDEEIDLLMEEDPDLFRKQISCDMELYPREVTVELVEELSLLEPFGQGNPQPLFSMKNVTICNPRFMGEGEAHVRFTAIAAEKDRVSCVLFQKAQEKKEMLCGRRPVNLTGTIRLQKWRGCERAQFIVEEMALCR